MTSSYLKRWTVFLGRQHFTGVATIHCQRSKAYPTELGKVFCWRLYDFLQMPPGGSKMIAQSVVLWHDGLDKEFQNKGFSDLPLHIPNSPAALLSSSSSPKAYQEAIWSSPMWLRKMPLVEQMRLFWNLFTENDSLLGKRHIPHLHPALV